MSHPIRPEHDEIGRAVRRTAADRVRPASSWSRAGKVRPTVLLWALGLPIPIVIIVFLIRGCSL